MNILLLLIPVALIIVSVAVWFFFWAVKSEQFDDLDRQGANILFDDDLAPNLTEPSATINEPSATINEPSATINEPSIAINESSKAAQPENDPNGSILPPDQQQ